LAGEEAMTELAKHKCTACGWIYDPRYGDPANEIARGIAWEKLPANFKCGVCGNGKDKFVRTEVIKK
jgi:rubredoxin